MVTASLGESFYGYVGAFALVGTSFVYGEGQGSISHRIERDAIIYSAVPTAKVSIVVAVVYVFELEIMWNKRNGKQFG